MSGFVVTMNRIPVAMAGLEQHAARVVDRVAHDIQADAQERAPYDTGFLRNSAYTKKVGLLTSEVGFTAGYHLYVELGTRYMRARPHLIPAWNAGRYRMLQEMRRMRLL